MAAPAPPARQVLTDRSVVALLLTGLFSATASVAQLTALGKFLFDLSGRDLDLGLLGLAEFVPAFVLMPVTGTVADRFDRRHVAGLALTGQLVTSGSIALYATSGRTETWPVFALVAAYGVARTFAAPALRSMPPDIAPDGGLPRLIALTSVCWQIALIAGPVVAGFLYLVGPGAPFVLCVALSGAAAVTIQFARPRRHLVDAAASGSEIDGAALVDLAEEQRAAESIVGTVEAPDAEAATTVELREPPAKLGRIAEAFEGLRVIRRTPVLLGAISLDLFAVLFGGAVALLPSLAENRFGVDAVGLGWLRASVGIGATIVTVALSIRPIRRHIGRNLFLVVALFGAFTIVLGLTQSFAVAFVSLMLLSAADSVSVFIRSTLVPLVTPSPARGRVMAVEAVFLGASNELGAFESGVAGQLLGTSGAVVLGGVATLGVVGAWTFLFPSLARLDRFPDRPPD